MVMVMVKVKGSGVRQTILKAVKGQNSFSPTTPRTATPQFPTFKTAPGLRTPQFPSLTSRSGRIVVVVTSNTIAVNAANAATVRTLGLCGRHD